jgi:adenosylmethionine-8-amino-7-oxononanoate aminotransferase
MPNHPTDDLAELDRRHLWHPFTQQADWKPLVIASASGCDLIDDAGNAYIDGVSSLWTNVHGHRHPHIDAAVRAQLDRMAHSTMLGLTHEPAVRLAAQLVHRAPAGLSRCFYSDNGSTAAEVAVKMAFQYHQQTGEQHRTVFATLRDAYHGDTLGAVSVGAIDLFHAVYKPLLFESVALPAPVTPGGTDERDCLDGAMALLEQHGERLSALIVEPLVQGAAGMKMHSVGFLRPLLERARALGVLVIADEVAVGFGRTGTLFAMEQVGVAPDLMCLAKGISAGYLPLAATLTTEAIYDAFLGLPAEYKQFFHGHTYTGNPLACAAALASLEVFDASDVLGHVGAISAQLEELLVSMREQTGVSAVRQRGVMVGIDLCDPVTGGPLDPASRTGHQVAMAARPLGAIIRPLGDTVVINPPLAISSTELTRLVGCVRDAIRRVMGH